MIAKNQVLNVKSERAVMMRQSDSHMLLNYIVVSNREIIYI